MQTSLEKLQAIIEGNYHPTAAESAELQQLWPASVNAAIATDGLMDDGDSDTDALRRKIAIRLGDDDAIFRILGEAGTDFDNFYPDPRHKSPSTEDTISAFLDKFSRNDPRTESLALEKMLFETSAAPSDYAATMLAGDTAAQPQQPDAAANEPQQQQEPEKEQTDENTLKTPELSMGFAQILIKNHKYTKALEIIEAISLNNPEKSIYFADQIRFLRKLIINDNKS